jgi:rhodanese-related sulfurtransferase
MTPEITCEELNKLRAENADIVLIDVREQSEYETCAISGSILIPLGTLPEGIQSLDKAKTYIIHCKMGGRSARAVAYMIENGFENVRNLVGGIMTWADEVDSSLAKY